jgi:eukaryotic-like serine/threonine-protein kinase
VIPEDRGRKQREEFARRYRLLERIAIGGTAEVFRAVHVGASGEEREVVVKRVLPQFARDERFRRLFLDEACVAVTIDHPNIVRVLDHAELDDTCYITLELVDGRDLGTLLEAARTAGRLPRPELAALVAKRVGEALLCIHDKTSSDGTPLRIIHRDVSPQNILVSKMGDVKLTDFGIAKSALRRDRTVDGTIRGKLDYMAPEQATLGEIDRRADLFALGCVLYEMVEGLPPCHGRSEVETLERVREARLRTPVSALAAPEGLRRVLDRTLRLDREARYPHAGALCEELERYLAAASPPPSSEELAAWSASLLAGEAKPSPRSRIDDTVRMLLGQGAEEAAPRRTSVFAHRATEAAGPEEGPTLETRRRRRRPGPTLLVLALVLLGLGGWILWATHFFDPRGGGSPARERAGAATGAGAARAAARGSLDGGAAPARPSPRIAVRSIPPGAALLVEGHRVGRTPLEIDRPSAPVVLELRRPGYRPWRRPLDPAVEPAVIEATLAPQPAVPSPPGPAAPGPSAASATATITVNSLPWSRVRLDGKIVGNTPLLALRTRAGRHTLELLAPDGKPRKSVPFTLESGERRTFTYDFTTPE